MGQEIKLFVVVAAALIAVEVAKSKGWLAPILGG